MSLPQIIAAEPLVTEEVVIPAKTFDRYWLATCNIQAFNVGGEATAHVELVKFNYNADTNEYTIAPNNPSIQLTIENLMQKALSGEDNDLATIMGLLLNYVIKVGRERGVVAPEA